MPVLGERTPQERDQVKEVLEAAKVKLEAIAGRSTAQYWLTRVVFLRSFAFLCFCAFAIALNQNGELLGEDGLTPAVMYMERLAKHVKQTGGSEMLTFPTLFWIYPPTTEALNRVATAGLGLSVLVLYRGAANLPIMLTLWALYMSIVTVGQTWYSFGWESQVLETAFLTCWLVPWLSLKRYDPWAPPPFAVVLAVCWLMFRIMLGAGLIKIRGDSCWRDLTCMDYHYQTMPVPNPLSPVFHVLPAWWHKFEVLSNHFIELPVPLFMFGPRKLRMLAGWLMGLFQVVIIVTGNFSFLNWLTILPCIYCFDDEFWSQLFSKGEIVAAAQARDAAVRNSLTLASSGVWCRVWYYVWRARSAVLVLLITYLSIPVVSNLLSERQVMNTSFNSLKLLNTYGAFGTITRVRDEVVLMGTRSDLFPAGRPPLDPNSVEWREYEFKCKPGDINRRPCIISPYHYRLDWLMWFSAFSNYQQHPWLVHLVYKLLDPDLGVRRRFASLLALDPFDDDIGSPPLFIRAVLYRYEYALGAKGKPTAAAVVMTEGGGGGGSVGMEEQGRWWRRRIVREYLPPVHRSNPTLTTFLEGHELVRRKQQQV